MTLIPYEEFEINAGVLNRLKEAYAERKISEYFKQHGTLPDSGMTQGFYTVPNELMDDYKKYFYSVNYLSSIKESVLYDGDDYVTTSFQLETEDEDGNVDGDSTILSSRVLGASPDTETSGSSAFKPTRSYLFKVYYKENENAELNNYAFGFFRATNIGKILGDATIRLRKGYIYTFDVYKFNGWIKSDDWRQDYDILKNQNGSFIMTSRDIQMPSHMYCDCSFGRCVNYMAESSTTIPISLKKMNYFITLEPENFIDGSLYCLISFSSINGFCCNQWDWYKELEYTTIDGEEHYRKDLQQKWYNPDIIVQETSGQTQIYIPLLPDFSEFYGLYDTILNSGSTEQEADVNLTSTDSNGAYKAITNSVVLQRNTYNRICFDATPDSSNGGFNFNDDEEPGENVINLESSGNTGQEP